ncbi:hypothetical protein NO1_0294, partial [Candidatus Termititenax aidoneus]
KNIRTTDLQRDFLTSLVSASVSSLGYAGGMQSEQALALGSLTTLSMKTLYTLSNIYDTTLDAANRLAAENLTDGDLAEELGLNRLTAAEKELLLQAIEYKNVSGEYGFQIEDRGRLEYIHALLDQLQKTQDLLLQMKAELDSGRGNVHSVLETGAADLESILKDYQNLHKQFIQQLMQSLKKGAGEITRRENSRQQQLLNLQLEAFDSALQALQSIAPFLDTKTDQQILNNFIQDLQPLSTLCRVLLLHFRRGEKDAAEAVDLSALNPGERLRVESAYASADLELTEIARNSGLYEQMLKMIDQTAQQIAKIIAKKTTEKTLSDRLDVLLKENLAALRKELDANTEKQRELREQIEALSAAVPSTHPFYATYLQPAWELCQTGDYAGVVGKLGALNDQVLGEAVLACREHVKELQKLAERAAQVEQALRQAESAAQTETQTLRETLDYLQKHGEEFAETQKLFAETAQSLSEYRGEIEGLFETETGSGYHASIYQFMLLDAVRAREVLEKVSPAAAEKLAALRRCGEDYQAMCRKITALTPLFQDRQRYTELLTALAQSAPQYGGEVAQLYSGLVSAQSMYAQFAEIRKLGDDLPKIRLLDSGLQTREASIAQAALFTRFGLTVPENLAEIEETFQEAQNVNQNYHPYTPSTDVSKLWESFFVERSRSRKAQEKAQASLDAARAAWEQADKDYELVSGLFAAYPAQEVNISGLNISQELKLYLNGVTGGAGIPPALRPRILEYLDRRRDNREIELLNNEADVDFAEKILTADWQEIQRSQEKYGEDMQKYLVGETEITLENLTEQRAELERKERAFRQKRERFLVQQKKGVIN